MSASLLELSVSFCHQEAHRHTYACVCHAWAYIVLSECGHMCVYVGGGYVVGGGLETHSNTHRASKFSDFIIKKILTLNYFIV